MIDLRFSALRLPAELPVRPTATPTPREAPVVLFMPALDEAPRIGGVLARVPEAVLGRPVVTVVVDDGSVDATAEIAAAAGAIVVSHEHTLGLGAAVRTGLAEGVRLDACVVAFCDADGEYDPAGLARLVAPILDRTADYVVGSRFAGRIESMRPHRRVGNLVLTWWVRWMTRTPVTDGQSGYRALSADASRHAHVAHDYNYAQVLTVDLVSNGYRYLEVPISYRFRTSGRSFVRLGSYLRHVVPAVRTQLRHARSRCAHGNTTLDVSRDQAHARPATSTTQGVRSS